MFAALICLQFTDECAAAGGGSRTTLRSYQTKGRYYESL